MKKRLIYLAFAVCFFHTLNVVTATDFCKLGDMGNFPLAFTGCGILCIVAAVVSSLIKAPQKA